jgi:uncharacterized FlaG/YvyC family protein
MKITQEPSPGTTAEAASVAANRVTNQRVTTQTPAKPAPTVTDGEKTPATAQSAPTAATAGRQTAVTFRRDTDGSVYYVVSDARTGDEILQVPPKAVRDAGQGIEEYLKSQESKATATATTRITVKA